MRARLHDSLDACYNAGGGDVLLRMRHTYKMVTKTSGLVPSMPVELSVSLFDSLGEFICSKGSSSIRYRVVWCINHRIQSNQFVGRRDEEEKECVHAIPTLRVYRLSDKYVNNSVNNVVLVKQQKRLRPYITIET